MTGDARGEAERIVTELKNEATFRSYGVWDSREVHDRVVAALAAAIEYRRAEKRQDRAFAQEDRVGELAAADDAAEWAVALDEAIEALGVDSEPPEESALRARAGEET